MDSFTLSNNLTEIVQLSEEDMYLVNRLAHEIWPVAYGEILSKGQLQYMLDWLYDINSLQEKAKTGHLYYAIKENGVARGYMAVEPNYPDAGYLRIHNLYVLPERHGSGLGRALVNQAIDVAFDLDLNILHLNVNRFNKAKDFYEHIGFKVVGEEDIDIGKGYLMEDYIMELHLFPDRI